MTRDDDQLDVTSLTRQIKELTNRLVEAHEGRSEESLTHTAGGGLVKATVSATGQLQHLEISPVITDPGNVEMLADTVVAAVQNAREAVAARYTARFDGLFDGLIDRL
ncbi:nucleoid-associated protein [Streptomyces fumigatiscleroticus]|nr:nucleoid-associated protein [Streptomyces fumigatiscleroticus]